MLCTHLLPDVQDVCDRVAILHEGRLCRQGSLDDLLMLRNQTQLTIENLTEEQQAELCGFLARMGRPNVTMVHPYDTLSSLFVQIIQSERARSEAPKRPDEHVGSH